MTAECKSGNQQKFKKRSWKYSNINEPLQINRHFLNNKNVLKILNYVNIRKYQT